MNDTREDESEYYPGGHVIPKTPEVATVPRVARGEDVYLKTQIVNGVQHYTRQVMAYDAEIGWGATWVGDYVLNSEGAYEAV